MKEYRLRVEEGVSKERAFNIFKLMYYWPDVTAVDLIVGKIKKKEEKE